MDYYLMTYVRLVEFLLITYIFCKEEIVFTRRKLLTGALILGASLTLIYTLHIEDGFFFDFFSFIVFFFALTKGEVKRRLISAVMALTFSRLIEIVLSEGYLFYCVLRDPDINIFSYIDFLYINLVACLVLIGFVFVRWRLHGVIELETRLEVKLIVLSICLRYLLSFAMTDWNISAYKGISAFFVSGLTLTFIGVLIRNFFKCLLHIKDGKTEVRELTENYVDSVKELYNASKENMEEVRILKHDLKNHVATINSLLKSQEYVKAQAYLDQLQGYTLEEGDKVFYTGNQTMDAILFQRKRFAGNLGVGLKVKGEISPSLKLSDYDLSSLMGNLISNACEYCREHGYKEVTILLHSDNLADVIMVINTLKKEDNLEESIKKTHKKDKMNHGYGLKSVKKIVSKAGGNFEIKREKDNCVAQVTLFK